MTSPRPLPDEMIDALIRALKANRAWVEWADTDGETLADVNEALPSLLSEVREARAARGDEREEGRREARAEVASILDRIVFTEIRGLAALALDGEARDEWIVRAAARKVLNEIRALVNARAPASEETPT